jgi:hypothetical protein
MRFIEIPALITEDIEDPSIVDITEPISASISGTTMTIDGGSKVSGEASVTLTGDVTVNAFTLQNVKQPSIHKISVKTNNKGNFTYVPNITVTASSVSTTTKTGSDFEILLITTTGGETYVDFDMADYVSPALYTSNALTGFDISELTSTYGATAKLYKPDGTLLTTVTSATTGGGVNFGYTESTPGDVTYTLEVEDDLGRTSRYDLPRKWISYAMSSPGFEKLELAGNEYTSTTIVPNLTPSSKAKVFRTNNHGYLGINFKIQGRNSTGDDWVDIANADEDDEVLAFGDFLYHRVWVKPTAKATTSVSSSNVVTLTLTDFTEENVTTSFTGADPYDINESTNTYVFEETTKIGTVPFTVTLGGETYTNAVTATTEGTAYDYVTLAFANPTLTLTGQNVTISSAKLYRDDVLFHTYGTESNVVLRSDQTGTYQAVVNDVYYSNRVVPDFTTTRSVSAPQLEFDGYNKLTFFKETLIQNNVIVTDTRTGGAWGCHLNIDANYTGEGYQWKLHKDDSSHSLVPDHDFDDDSGHGIYRYLRYTGTEDLGSWTFYNVNTDDSQGSQDTVLKIYSSNGSNEVTNAGIGSTLWVWSWNMSFSGHLTKSIFTPTSTTLGVPDGTTRDLTTQSNVYIYEPGTYTANVQTSETFAYLSNVVTSQPSQNPTDVGPTFTFDEYNRLAISNLTQTSSTLEYGSNTYDTNTASNVYVTDAGEYKLEARDANTFVMSNVYVGGVSQHPSDVVPTLTFDGYNKLTIDNVDTIETATIKKDGAAFATTTSNTVYIRDTGTYTAEVKGSNVYAIELSNVVTGSVVPDNGWIFDETTSIGLASEILGFSVSISGDLGIVGSRDDNVVYFIKRVGTTWFEDLKISESNRFGWSVGISGNYAVVGSSSSNTITIYKYNGTTWNQIFSQTHSSYADGVAIDGDNIITGRRYSESQSILSRVTDTSWTRTSLTENSYIGEYIGHIVAISGVYAMSGIPDYQSSKGGVAVYYWDGTSWDNTQILQSTGVAANDLFGSSVSIDGDYAVIGATGVGTGGKAYIFVRSGTSWSQQYILESTDTLSGDDFGWSVSISGDTVVVGSIYHDVNGVNNVGALYIYERNGTNWDFVTKKIDSTANQNTYLAWSVSISGDYILSGTHSQGNSVYPYGKGPVGPNITYDNYNKITLNQLNYEDTAEVTYYSNAYNLGTAKTMYVKDTGEYVFKISGTDKYVESNVYVSSVDLAGAPTKPIDFDGYNKLTLIDAGSNVSANVTYFSNTYELGSANVLYINGVGTYDLEMSGSNVFALSNTVVGTVSQHPTDVVPSLTFDNYNKLTLENFTTVSDKQWPPADGTRSSPTWSDSDKVADWTITGASYGNGSYKGTSSVAVWSDSSNHAGPYWAFNNDDSTADDECWHPQSIVVAILTIEMPSSMVLGSYELYYRNYTDYTCGPKDWTVEGSNDGSTWTVLDTRTNQPQVSAALAKIGTYTVSNSTSYSKYRLNVTANHGGDQTIIGEWKLFEKNPRTAKLTDPNGSTYALGQTQDTIYIHQQGDYFLEVTNSDQSAVVKTDVGTVSTPSTVTPTYGGTQELVSPFHSGGLSTTVTSSNLTGAYTPNPPTDSGVQTQLASSSVNSYDLQNCVAWNNTQNTDDTKIFFTFPYWTKIDKWQIWDARRDWTFTEYHVWFGSSTTDLTKYATYSFSPTNVWNDATPNNQTQTLSSGSEQACKVMAFSFTDPTTNPNNNDSTIAGPGVARIKIWGYQSATSTSSLVPTLPKLDFDTYNKLSIENLTPTSTTLTDPNGSSFDIGTASNVYIEDAGTYKFATGDANTFALVSNVVGTVSQHPEDVVPSLTYDTSNKLSIANLTPTSTTLTDPNGSSFDIGTASNVYIRDSGTYSIASKDANTFLLASNTVTGTPTGTTYVYDSNTFTTPSQTYDTTKTITVSNVPSTQTGITGKIYKGSTAYPIHATTSSSNVIIKNTGTYVSVFTTATQAFLTNAIGVTTQPTTTSDDTTIEDVAPIVTTSVDTILAFHYGSFDTVYGDADVTEAANNGHIFDDTPSGTYDWGTLGTPSTASNQTTYTWTPSSSITGADVLMVAGGGGGGGSVGAGGGGAGGLLHHTNQTISGQNTIVIGNGGTGGIGYGNREVNYGEDGKDTTFTGFDNVIGGGGGGSHAGADVDNASIEPGRSGGSGGGAGYNDDRNGGNGTSGQGNGGGSSYGGEAGGGGGGAGSAGGNASNGAGASGGTGIDKTGVFGTMYGDSGWFASGGGGGGRSENRATAGTASQGGGSSGKVDNSRADDAQKHTGGGGGGGGFTGTNSGQQGGNGGSGIVLLKFINVTTTGGLAGSTAVPDETTTVVDAPSVTLDATDTTVTDPTLDLDFTTQLPRTLKRYNGLSNSSIGARFNRRESRKKRIEKRISIPSSFSAELTANNASSPTTLTVTVANSKFVINGDETPTLGFIRGETYTFDQSDASNGDHPLVLATSEDGATLYETGWVNNVFTVPYDVPDTIYYKCSNHNNMGGEIHTTFGNAFSLGDFTVAANTHVSGEYTLATNYDGTTSNLYVNGTLITQTAPSPAISAGVKDFILGKEFDGYVKNFKFWNYAKPFLATIIAFHYGSFDTVYGDADVNAAAAAGHVFDNTPAGTYPWGTITLPSTASNQTTYTWTPSDTITADVLIVAGGGGGGGKQANAGGGGGAGGLIFAENETIVTGTYSIVVGKGGGSGGNGNDSSAFNKGAYGGGGGADRTGGPHSGGSGGGGNGINSEQGGSSTQTTGGFGNNGGDGATGTDRGCGGGGGAGAAGGNGNGEDGGNGGIGLDYSSVFDTTYGDSGWFAGGGGGAGQSQSYAGSGVGGTGALGGGGNGYTDGGIDNINAVTASPHTGGGGGGSGGGNGGPGGSGIVIIRYAS